jgi:hypothetical protein
MAENKIKESKVNEPEEGTGSVTEAVKEPKPRKKKSSRGARSFIRFMNLFGVFDRNQIVHSMPFILFITLLIIGYIANSYYAERVIREIDRTKTELKEKRAEYISTKSELVSQSKQSEVAKALESAQVKESTQPPKRIVMEVEKEQQDR